MPNPTARAQQQPSPAAQWPEGVIARYLTVAGATVDLTEIDRDERGGGVYETRTNCTGCPTTGRFHWEHGKEQADNQARALASISGVASIVAPLPSTISNAAGAFAGGVASTGAAVALLT